MRQFYLEYPDLIAANKICHAVRGELEVPNSTFGFEIHHALRGELDSNGKFGMLNPNLSWTHYRNLLKVRNLQARCFYEIESAKDGWSARQLERQIDSFFKNNVDFCKKFDTPTRSTMLYY